MSRTHLVAAVASSLALLAGACHRDRGAPPAERMSPCPDSPNCVASHAEGVDQRMPPLVYTVAEEDVLRAIEEVVAAAPRAGVVVRDGLYVRAEFSSRLFGFVDDVEFLLDPETRTIQFRSASRTGYSDLGVNRARMESISRELALREGISVSED